MIAKLTPQDSMRAASWLQSGKCAWQRAVIGVGQSGVSGVSESSPTNLVSWMPMRGILVLILISAPAAAQEFRAALTGRVVDPGDAHIRGAAVVVTNTGANIVSSTRTD